MTDKRRHLRLIDGGKTDEARAREKLYPRASRKVLAEPKPRPPYTPPTKPAA